MVTATSDRYLRFATREAHGESACYEEWAHGVAHDPVVLALLDALPSPKRQPNLLFASARYVGIPAGPYPAFRAELRGRWPEVRTTILSKRTQTNEPGRCAALLPLLAALPQPLALLEVGASAGLCLYPDRYSYRYDDRPQLDPPTGPSPVVLTCATSGPVPFPARVPDVAWRAGIDLNPLDLANPDDVRWLEALIWPEHEHRRRRLAAAATIVDRPRIVRGDLNFVLPTLAAEAPGTATLVVFHSAVLPYLDQAERDTFVHTVTALDAHWISNEGSGMFDLALDGTPVARAAGHGHTIRWL